VVALYAHIYVQTHTHCHSMIVFLIVYCGFLSTTARTELDSHVVTVCVCVCARVCVRACVFIIIDGRKATQGYDNTG
jgi:hypothetical protein